MYSFYRDVVKKRKKNKPQNTMYRWEGQKSTKQSRRIDIAKWSEGKEMMKTTAIAIRTWTVEHQVSGSWTHKDLTYKKEETGVFILHFSSPCLPVAQCLKIHTCP